MDAWLALIGAILGGGSLKALDVYFHDYNRKKRELQQEADYFASTLFLENTLPDEDREWVDRMLQAAEISPRVVQTCSCGLGGDCYIHCNHEIDDGVCLGPAQEERWSGRII